MTAPDGLDREAIERRAEEAAECLALLSKPPTGFVARSAAVAPALAPGEGTYACRCGAWRGWELVVDANPPTVAPCRSCRPEVREQWEGGHHVPDHSCATCDRRKRGVTG